jgi:hypothetical protein
VLYRETVARGTKKIDELAELLEKTGGDAVRLDALRRAQRFKRSWVELAEALTQIRSKRSYESWGYEDFYDYCGKELQIRRATVDKLTLSYSTIKQHRPQVLTRDGVAKVIPSYQSIDYFSRAVEDSAANGNGNGRARGKGPSEEVVKELGRAVFDEGQSVAELRKRFDPLVRPKPKGADDLERMQKAFNLARRLVELLPDIDGLSAKRVREVERTIGALREDLDGLMEPLREKVERRRRKLKPPRPTATATK